MNTEKNNKIEQILSSLDATEKAAMPDFFYTRLKAKMQSNLESKSKVAKAWLLRPAYVLSALTIVLIINIAIIFNDDSPTKSTNGDTETAQSIAAEYSLNDNNALYDLTLEK
jgi:hypothetical protein